MDRDVVASMNIAYKWRSRFCHPRGLSVEAVKGNVGLFEPLISSRWKQVGCWVTLFWCPIEVTEPNPVVLCNSL
ncbi:MAG: hypothetical protein ABI337_02140 [Nitrososphaera sp.]